MKMFLMAALMMSFAAVAEAGNRFSVYPMVGGVPVNQLCDAGSSFRTLGRVAVCTEWRNDVKEGELYAGNEWTCISKSTKRNARISKSYTSSVCVDEHDYSNGSFETEYPRPCRSFAKSTKRFGRTFRVPVYEDRGELGLVQVAEHRYTVPSCH